MPRDGIRRSARSSLAGLHVAMTFVGLGSLFAPLLCGVTACGQDLVPAPPDMKAPQGGSPPVFAPVQLPEEIEGLPSFETPSSSFGEAMERHFGVLPPTPHADPGDRTKPDKTQVKDRLLEAEECLANRKYDDALEFFALAIAYDHSSIRAHLGRARAFMMQSRYKTAIEDVDFIIDRDPDHLEALQIRAFCSLYLGMAGSAEFLDSAARTVARILKSEPTNPAARAIHGAIALAERDPDLAIAELSYAIHKQLDWPDEYYYRGAARMVKGEYRQALDDFNRITRRRAAREISSRILFDRGRCYAGVGDSDLAIADFTVLIERHPHDFRLYQCRADAYAETNDITHALADHDQMVRLRGDDAEVFLKRAILRVRKGDSALALADMDRMVQLKPQASGAYFCRAVISVLGQGDTGRALADMDRAIALEPGLAFYYALRGYLRGKKLDCGPALKDFLLCSATLDQLEFKLTWNLDRERGRFFVGFGWWVKENANANANPGELKRTLEASNVDGQCIDWGVRRILAAAFEPAR